MTNYELVRNKVIEAVPEIIELKMGCKVLYGSEKTDESTAIIGCPYEVRDKKIVNPYNLDDSEYLLEIIGREIRLSDVLRAIESFAIMKVQEMEDSQMRLINKWSLTHDSLEWHRDNRPETVDFLAEILK